ncbi:hypothetical protein CKN86_02165 [Carnobacterium divergens]|uniref:hypothetical protein n=1 Tax=Carnobacterium divergens TaxID=2748 RepID=UPI000D48F4F9|nr:hypothetical protein [Carnobacterium divergens]MCO6018281.1 hypothetical protein [Carnobacterium divergens]TFI64856.1 hypothetical protein CKN62_02165 [Carnobacterium divergens]TFI91730.1 hypothetical protein CKN84_02165 [Carnobacterium divergens]TFJ07061.1 hypothetical protein CKN86_02165 [Carnobacterium divergens]TFJ08286.1 hypothetical protein CKN65_02165 [Carnobacterium divergens]
MGFISNVFVLIFLISAFGIYYFIKKKPNKKYRNYSAIALIVCLVLVGITAPKSNTSSIKNADKETADSSKKDITLKLNKETVETDQDGKAIIEGKTTPSATIQIGFGIENKSAEADEKGNFSISYKFKDKEEQTIEIISSLDGNSKTKKIKVTPSTEYMKKVERQEQEKEAEKLSKEQEKENKKNEKALKEKADKDITILSETPTSQQSARLTTLATQVFEKKFPYKGSKINATGVTQDWMLNDGKWFYKGEATINNAYGSKRIATIEITVTPTSEDTGIVDITDY